MSSITQDKNEGESRGDAVCGVGRSGLSDERKPDPLAILAATMEGDRELCAEACA